MPQVFTNHRAGPINSAVLLFSGGMDSVCIAHLCHPDLLLYVPSHSAYNQAEDECIQQLVRRNLIAREKLIILSQSTLNLRIWERDDMIVPNRNAHLLLLASNFGDHLMLASVEGDRSNDKDEYFYHLMKQLLNHMWDEQHWTAQRKFTVSSPAKNWTKAELVHSYLRSGGTRDALLTSYSCYAGYSTHCGICKPCARKWVALALNGVRTPKGYFREAFWDQEWFQKAYPLMLEQQYRGREDEDFVRFVRNPPQGYAPKDELPDWTSQLQNAKVPLHGPLAPIDFPEEVRVNEKTEGSDSAAGESKLD